MTRHDAGNPCQRVHPFIRMRRRVQNTQRRDHLARGADRRVLKEGGASPAKGTSWIRVETQETAES